jgi:DNA (cytosine-5)-methyltransferase 1
LENGVREAMIAIDAFAGAGGMSTGASLAGISVHSAIEYNRHAAATYRYNHPKTAMLETDIRELDGDSFALRRRPDMLFGGPPCQGFSTSNQRTRGKENQSNWLYQDFLRLAQQTDPQWIVIENVKGILETAGGHFIAAMRRGVRRMGYSTTDFVLQAHEHGVPQRRARFFLVARRGARDITSLQPRKRRRTITVTEAFADLPILQNGADVDVLPYCGQAETSYANGLRGRLSACTGHLVSSNSNYVLQRYRTIPQGGNWEDIPARLMKNYADRFRCHTGIYRRLRGDEPSVVVGNYRKNMLIHPTQDRGLSVREAARLQSFPDKYKFCGTIGLQQQQVGNAVPPLLAKALFAAIADFS